MVIYIHRIHVTCMVYLHIFTYTFYHENQPFMWINISAPWILWDRKIYNIPGGGNSNLFNVHPEPWGRWTQFDYSNIFSKGVGKNHQLGNHCHFIEIEGGLTKNLRDFSKKASWIPILQAILMGVSGKMCFHRCRIQVSAANRISMCCVSPHSEVRDGNVGWCCCVNWKSSVSEIIGWLLGCLLVFLGGVQKRDIGRLVGDESEVYQCLMLYCCKARFWFIYLSIHLVVILSIQSESLLSRYINYHQRAFYSR